MFEAIKDPFGGLIIGTVALASLSSLDAQSRTEVVAVVDGAKVRLEPNTNSAIIESLPLGASLEAPAEANGWFQVKLPRNADGFERLGYIAATVVEKRASTVESPAKTSESRSRATPDSISDGISAGAAVLPALSVEELRGAANKAVQDAVHAGYAQDEKYWRQLAKVVKVLERRRAAQFNLVLPILATELNEADKFLPVAGPDPTANIAQYRTSAVESIALIETGGRQIDWLQTLGGVKPERGRVGRAFDAVSRKAGTIIVYGINPLAGVALSAATKQPGQ